MKFAYFGVPHTGGTYTVYDSLRVGLASHGVKVKWLGLGPQAQAAFDNPTWAHEREHGDVVAGSIGGERQQAEALIRYLESSDFDGVFVNVLAGRVETNAMRYLDPAIRRVMIVHNITPGTYAAARAVRRHVHATIGVSPRIQTDLIRKHQFPADRTFSIPNAIDLGPFCSDGRNTKTTGALRILSLGRVVDTDKGVFWLPKIMAQLTDCPVALTIAGDGPDLAELKKRFAPMGDRVRFVGRVASVAVPGLFAEHDVFISPSRFEGLPLTLVEAMAAGCVPVATRIRGVTDFVIKDGVDGRVFPMGDVAKAARCLAELAGDREQLKRMSLAARNNVADRFEVSGMAARYFAVLTAVVKDPTVISPPLHIGRWSYPGGLRPGWRRYLPTGVKNQLRRLRERLA